MPPHSSVSDSLSPANAPPSLRHLHWGGSDSSGMEFLAALRGGQHFNSDFINNITLFRTFQTLLTFAHSSDTQILRYGGSVLGDPGCHVLLLNGHISLHRISTISVNKS